MKKLERRLTSAIRLKLEREIAIRKRLEEELIKSANQLNAIVTAYPDLYFIMDGRGTIIDYHAREKKDLYVPPSKFLGRKMQDVLPPETGRLFHTLIKDTLKSRSTTAVDYWLPMRGGKRWFEARMSPLGGGKVIAIVRNITERKLNEDKLRESKDFADMLINSSVDGILAFDTKFRYTAWNPAMEKISGVSREQVLGRCAFDVFPFLKEIGEDKYFKLALSGKAVTSQDRPYTVPESGNQGYFEGHYSPVRGHDGRVIGGLAIIRDITEKKKEADNLRYANEELSQFAHIVAHDLSEPLQKILVFSGMLRKRHTQDLNSEAIDFLERMNNAAMHMLNILTALTQYSAADATRRPFEPVNLRESVGAAMDALELQIRGRQAAITVKKLPVVEADGVQMALLFQNLISNSIKFCPPNRTPRIIIWSSRASPNTWRIYVKDNSIGFRRDCARYIFRPFYRGHDGGKYDGLGIGLATCNRIVRRHNGNIATSSRLGKGATFIITLPERQDRNLCPAAAPTEPEEVST